MEGSVSFDLSPVILAIETQTETLQQQLQQIQAYQSAAIGVILGAFVLLVLAVMFR